MDTNTKLLLGAAVAAGLGLIVWSASSKTVASSPPPPTPPAPPPPAAKPDAKPGQLTWVMVPINLDGPTVLPPGMYGLSDDMRGSMPDINEVQTKVFGDKGEVVYLGSSPPDRWPIDDRGADRGYMVFRVTKTFTVDDVLDTPTVTWRLYQLVEQQPVATRPYTTPGVNA